MTFFESHITFFAFAALLVASRYADQRSSVIAPWYGAREGNPLMRDEYGGFSTTKNYIGSGIALLAGALLHFLIKDGKGDGSAAYMMIYGPIIGGSIFIAIKNYFFLQRKRKQQIAFLTKLRSAINDGLPDDQIAAVFNPLVMITTHGRSRYELFGYVYVDGYEDDIAFTALQNKLKTIAQKPAAEWFEGK